MPYQSLREYLDALEARGLLVRVQEELSPVLEIPALLLEAMRVRGPALLFERVKGYPEWRVVGNIFGSFKHLEVAFGTKHLEEIGSRILEPFKLVSSVSPPTSLLKTVLRMVKARPTKTRKGPVQENIDENPSFSRIPAFKTWPKDAGRYLTFPIVVVREPDTGSYNLGVYRVMIVDDKRAIIHWQIHKRGAEAAEAYGSRRIPVAIVIGAQPSILFAGVAPIPKPIDKYVFASIIDGEGVKLVETHNGLLVPATAEVVLEGYVDLNETMLEGPFGDHYGYYTPPARYPVFHLERMMYRTNPIYYGTIVGRPYCEDATLGKAVERMFLPVLKLILPEIVDINLPAEGLFQGLAIVSIRKRYPGHAKKVMMALWGLGQLALTKIIIVVDHDVNVHDMGQVIEAIAANVDPARDVVIIPHAHVDVLDHSTPVPGYGSKMGIDATRKLPEEYDGKEWPEKLTMDPKILEKIQKIALKLKLYGGS